MSESDTAFLFFFLLFLALLHKIPVQAVDCGRCFPGSLSDLGALLMPFYPESVTLLRACDSRGSGGNWLSTDYADFLTSSRLLCPQLIIIIFLVPFFGCLAVRLTICFRGTVFAVFLARRIDNSLIIFAVMRLLAVALFFQRVTAGLLIPASTTTADGDFPAELHAFMKLS